MLKFRTLKDKIIYSKRNSQKLDEQELLHSMQPQPSLSRINMSLNAKLQAEINQITQDSYKIIKQEHVRDSRRVAKSSARKSRRDDSVEATEYLRTEVNCTEELKSPQTQDFQLTAKKGSHLTRSVIEGSNFTKIIDLMKEVNDLQQRKADCPKESPAIKEEIRRKLAEVKFLICTIEDQSQKSLIDFYNEECEANNSPDSFHSQNSDETYRLQSEREAYEFSASKQQEDTNSTEEEGNVEIKYRRISPSNYDEDSIYDTLYDEAESPQCSTFEEKTALEKSIVHLFSYEKDRSLGSPLSRITERESEYSSPSSKPASLAQSLEFKKICYLLQTSQKKQETTYRKEVSEFTPSKRSNNRSTGSNESKDRSRCHFQLQEMITLLQTKYRRKVKIGVENLMDSLNIAIKQKSIRLRTRK